MSNDRNVDFVLRTVEKRNIRFVRLWFTDILGNLKSFAISPEELAEAFEEGIGFDGSAVDGFTMQEETDVLAFPDPETFQILPWRPNDSGVARVFCDIRTADGEPFEGDPRSCLERVFEQADEQGYVFNVGPKFEYFYFADQGPEPTVVDNAGYFDLTPYDSARDLRRQTTLLLEKMSIPVQYSYHSSAPSQNGIELRYSEGVSSADNVMTARLVIKQTANEANLFASFMPKPLQNELGSGMFLYESLLDHNGENLFWQEEGNHLTPLAQHYIAGILKYAPEFTLVTNPTVNSYKRLQHNGQVPVFATWGERKRSNLVRIPTNKPSKRSSMRIELRSPDPTANPYLAFAVTLAAGMAGIDQNLELPPELPLSVNEMSEEQLAASGYQRLPRTMGEAIAAFEKSDLMRDTLGDYIYNFLLDNKRREWEDFCSSVTDWEKRHYYGGF